MTTYIRGRLVCECGHEGQLQCSESDQSFSGLWVSYRLEGFNGRNLVTTNYKDMPKDLLSELGPTCPACGQTNKVSFDHA